MKFSLQNVPILKVRGNNLARSKRSAQFKEDLKFSIKTHGILQPVLCCVDGEFFRLVAGFGRFDCAKDLGLTEIPAQVYEGKITDDELLILACQENNLKEGTHFMDQADSLERLVKLKKCTETEAGKMLGLKQSLTSKILSANARLADDVKLKLTQEAIGYSIAYILSKESNHEKQRELVKTFLANKWTRADLEKAMRPESKRSLSYGDSVSFHLSYPVEATYELLKAEAKKLLDAIAQCERMKVPVELIPKMIQVQS